jgi:hypothetical protein
MAQTSIGGLAQPCGAGAGPSPKVPANAAVSRTSLLSVALSDSACHAGRRGFESRRSRRNALHITVFCCRTWRKRPPGFPTGHAPIPQVKPRTRSCHVKVLLIAMFCDRGKAPKSSVIPPRSRKWMASSTAGVEEQLERRELMLTVGLARAARVRPPCLSGR